MLAERWNPPQFGPLAIDDGGRRHNLDDAFRRVDRQGHGACMLEQIAHARNQPIGDLGVIEERNDFAQRTLPKKLLDVAIERLAVLHAT